MSTIRVNAIQHTTANSGNMILHANGNVSMITSNTTLFVGNTAISNAGISVGGTAINPLATGMRNRIINGDMRIDQRTAGANTVITSDQSYVLDRWKCYQSQSSKYSVQQVSSSLAGFTNALKITSLSSYTVGASERFLIGHGIEGVNCADLGLGTTNAKTLTLSFWVNSSLTGTFGVTFGNSNSTRCYPSTYTINSANTWEYKTVTFNGDITGSSWVTDNSGGGLWIYFDIGTGSTYKGTVNTWNGSTLFSATGASSLVGTSGATLQITGVQLEVGTTATPFEFRHYGHELALCQRYYQSFTIPSYIGMNGSSLGSGYTVYFGLSFPLKVSMRASPTILQNISIITDNAGVQTFTADTEMYSLLHGNSSANYSYIGGTAKLSAEM